MRSHPRENVCVRDVNMQEESSTVHWFSLRLHAISLLPDRSRSNVTRTCFSLSLGMFAVEHADKKLELLKEHLRGR